MKGRRKMLRTDLPEIITATLPGPKAQAVIDRRAEAVPSAIRCAYPLVIEKGEGAMIQDVDCLLYTSEDGIYRRFWRQREAAIGWRLRQ